jgi:hypothetical protein
MPIKNPDSNTKRHRNHCSRAEHSIKRVPKSIATVSGRKGDAWNGLRVVGRAKAGEERKGTFACGAVGQGESAAALGCSPLTLRNPKVYPTIPPYSLYTFCHCALPIHRTPQSSLRIVFAAVTDHSRSTTPSQSCTSQIAAWWAVNSWPSKRAVVV